MRKKTAQPFYSAQVPEIIYERQVKAMEHARSFKNKKVKVVAKRMRKQRPSFIQELPSILWSMAKPILGKRATRTYAAISLLMFTWILVVPINVTKDLVKQAKYYVEDYHKPYGTYTKHFDPPTEITAPAKTEAATPSATLKPTPTATPSATPSATPASRKSSWQTYFDPTDPRNADSAIAERKEKYSKMIRNIFSEAKLSTAQADYAIRLIAECENGKWRGDVDSKPNTDGTQDHGLFRVNDGAHKARFVKLYGNWDLVYDPVINAEYVANWIVKPQQNFSAWSCSKSVK